MDAFPVRYCEKWVCRSLPQTAIDANRSVMNKTKLKPMILVVIGICLTASALLGAEGSKSSSATGRPDLEYLKKVNQVGPPHDPQLLFLLMGEYANANMQVEGA